MLNVGRHFPCGNTRGQVGYENPVCNWPRDESFMMFAVFFFFLLLYSSLAVESFTVSPPLRIKPKKWPKESNLKLFFFVCSIK